MTQAATVEDVLTGDRSAAALGAAAHALYALGFEHGVERMRPRLEQAEQQADYWFLRAHYTEAELSAMTNAAIDAAFESGAIAWLDESDPSASWSEARALTARRAS